MIVNIWITTSEWSDEYEIYEEGKYVEVDVPLDDIAEMLGKHYGISGKTMKSIINDYDLDLTQDLDAIKELAYEIWECDYDD